MDNKKILKTSVSCFIIPNKIGTINNNLLESQREKNEKLFNEIFELNGIDRTIDPANDKLVQLWFHSKELDTDNLVRHGGTYVTVGENGIQKIRINPDIEVLPACLFAGKFEGETFNLKVPDDDYILDMDVTLDQLDYRYGNFGTFEEVLERVSDIQKIVKIRNGKLRFDADGFIIPNHADVLDDVPCWKDDINFVAYLNIVCKLNGYGDMDPARDHIVDVWITSKKDMKSENLSDHGATIIGDDGEEEHIQLYSINKIPEKILYGHKEGETFLFKAPWNPNDPHHPERGGVILECQLRLAQQEYRYKRFGKFEEVLAQVCR